MSRPINNYARHCITGTEVWFADGHFHPKRPADWAVWRPIERLRSMKRIGEDPDVYILRQLETTPARNEASMLRRRWKREGFDLEMRERIDDLKRIYLGENDVN